MRRGVATLAVVALAASAAVASSDAARSSAPQSGRQTKSATAILETAVISRINAVRRRHGLRALRHNVRLAAAADFHSRDMVRRGYFEHSSANGTVFWRRIERFYPSRGFNSWTVGENLLWATDRYGAAFTVREWMNSPPHRSNILSRDWHEVGIGAVYTTSAPGEYGGRAVTIVTADFGSRR
jgi:uncharacterized protein YkwD